MLPVIINASAGSASPDELGGLQELLRAAGLDAEVRPVGAEDLRETVAAIARSGPPAIIAGGGDGTLNTVVSVLAGTDIPLGILPLGTLNHFAKDLRVPLDLTEAVQVIAQGHTTRVDVGTVNGQVFINNSSLGLYPYIVRDREFQQRRLGRGKWPALAWATLTALRRSPLLTLRLCVDHTEELCTTSFVFIGNNEYVMEGFNIGVRERLDTGRLSIYRTQRRSRGRLVTLALRALAGLLHQADDFEMTTARSLTVETRRRRLYVATDGEVRVMQPPLKYAIRPRALRVFVPAPEA